MMATIAKLTQGSPEWHAHRKHHRNASESPAVLGVSEWLTPYQLWLEKTGRAQRRVSVPMTHGTQLEPRAREAYERLTGMLMEPVVLVDGEYSASFDGITLDGDLVLEIKCPYQGQGSALWQAVEAGEVPPPCHWQLQHQLMVAKADLAHLYVFDGKEGLLLEVKPAPADWPRIHEGWESFMRFIREDRAPPLTAHDAKIRDDPEWQTAAHEFIAWKSTVDEATERLEAAKRRLISLTSHTSEQGAGVSVSRYWKSGAIDYKRVAQLLSVDLEQYRAPSREETRVTVLKP